jgi:hypothetical protein
LRVDNWGIAGQLLGAAPALKDRSPAVPFNDAIEVVVEQTDGAGPPRRGWLGDVNGPADAPAGKLAGAVWLVSRHGRYGRAIMLHQHLSERRGTRRHAPRRRRPRVAQGLVLGTVLGHARRVRRLDADALRRWTVRGAIRWARVTGCVSRHRPRPRLEAAVGALAAPLVLPAVALAAVAIVVLLAADLGLWAVLGVGGSIRTAIGRPPKEVAPPSFDWTPS